MTMTDDRHEVHPLGVQPGSGPGTARTARDLLEGHAPRVIADLNVHHDTLTQTGTRAPGLKRTIAYLTAKQPYLIYRIALTMGWPIATGVIEGTCRYLVRTGSRSLAPGGACPAQKPYCCCEPQSTTAISTPTGSSICSKNTNAPTPAATSTNTT